jgi:hypothetical protein
MVDTITVVVSLPGAMAGIVLKTVVVDVELVYLGATTEVMVRTTGWVAWVSKAGKVTLTAKPVGSNAALRVLEMVVKTVTVKVPAPASEVLVASSEEATLRCEAAALRIEPTSVTVID